MSAVYLQQGEVRHGPFDRAPTWFNRFWTLPDGAQVFDADGETWELVAADTPARPRHIWKLAFRNRFTQPEKVAIEMAAIDSAEATTEQRQIAAALRASVKDMDAATFVDLDLAMTRLGVLALEQYGLLAAGRAIEILDAPVQEWEYFNA